MNNFQPTGTYGNLIGSGTRNIPLSNSDDAKLLRQQSQYAALLNAYIGGLSVTRNGKDFTGEAQRFYLAMAVSMTFATAQAYFPAVSEVFWSAGVTDYRATYNTVISTPYPA